MLCVKPFMNSAAIMKNPHIIAFIKLLPQVKFVYINRREPYPFERCAASMLCFISCLQSAMEQSNHEQWNKYPQERSAVAEFA